MGTYLSTPVTDKHKESGESLESTTVPVSWGLVDMQGWRKSMEDAHIAVTGLSAPQHLLSDSDRESAGTMTPDAKVFGVFDGHGGAEVARFCQLYFVSVLMQQSDWKEMVKPEAASEEGAEGSSDPSKFGVGRALISCFHAMDRLIHDPARRAEIYALRTTTLADGERRTVDSIPSLSPSDTVSDAGAASPDTKPPAATESETTKETSEIKKVPEETSAKATPKETSDNDKSETSEPEKSEQTDDKKEGDGKSDDKAEATDDDDSMEVVGKEDAAEKDQDMVEKDEAPTAGETSSKDDTETVELTGSKVAGMFAKILQLGGVTKSPGAGGAEPGEGQAIVNLNQLGRAVAGTKSGASAALPTIIHNGQMMCNLPEHPVHAGCTAIVAVLTGRVLTVANAGDSRAVLCRAGGVTHPMSFDHKPQQEREMSRIINAGGYVNHLGRVNGNLNLSRSIGDLKYKQVPGVSPAEQIISAEPDIKQVTLKSDDEFIILGCDGIWDCLTNEQAVEYVRSRIDRMTPTEIGEAMLSEIISDDPRVTQGIGGDNMTIMVVDLQPQSRKRPATPAAAAENEKATTE